MVNLKKNIINEALDNQEYIKIVEPILNSQIFDERKNWVHHEDVSLYEHLLMVSYLSYKICKKKKWDYKDAAIGGLLHDFYSRPWQEHTMEKVPFFKQHGFVHASEAKKNANIYFPDLMNSKVLNIIERHMFPLNIKPPKYKEGWVVTYVDKKVSMSILYNFKSLPKYLGLSRFANGFIKRKKRK